MSSLLRFSVGAVLVIAITAVSAAAGDEAALLAFKAQLRSDGGSIRALASWISSAQFCSWKGVTCSRRRPTRAVALSLPGSGLTGALSPALGNLTFLRTLNLSYNELHGEIPGNIGRLRRLQMLDLSYNSFSGKFPLNLSSCISITFMALDSNKIVGHLQIHSEIIRRHTMLQENVKEVLKCPDLSLAEDG